jgi:hypothetical protein
MEPLLRDLICTLAVSSALLLAVIVVSISRSTFYRDLPGFIVVIMLMAAACLAYEASKK